jgi:uncharacterized protein
MISDYRWRNLFKGRSAENCGYNHEMQPLAQPLTDHEIEHLADFLYGLNHGEAMSLEELDGFFCALICGPEVVPPSEYLPYIWGGELVQGRGFKTIEEVQEIMTLLTRHWNTIADTLLRGNVHVPLIFDDENGIAMGNEWAIGFERGTHLRSGSWEKLVDDDEHWGALTPMILLAHEHDPDPEMRGDPLTPEKREELLCHMAVCTLAIYDFFRGRKPGEARRRKPGRTKRRGVQ